MNIKMAKTKPSQKALKFPETKPESIFSDAPPSLDAATVSVTWIDLGLVNTLVISGISAAPKVPQLIIVESVIHRCPGKLPIRK